MAISNARNRNRRRQRETMEQLGEEASSGADGVGEASAAATPPRILAVVPAPSSDRRCGTEPPFLESEEAFFRAESFDGEYEEAPGFWRRVFGRKPAAEG